VNSVGAMPARKPHFLTRPTAEDEGTLAEQGYKQELNRSWGLLHNFGVSFSIIVSQGRPQREKGPTLPHHEGVR